MAQETEKERIYREAFEEITRVCDAQEHIDNHLLRFFLTKKMMDIENLPVSTVEELQERCNRYEKALTEIYNLHYGFNPTEKGKCGFIAHDALAAIGGNDE